MEIYRSKISEEVDIENISDSELINIFDQMGRDLVYNYLLLGKNVTYSMFINNLKIYLDLKDCKMKMVLSSVS
jgi:hypothetical protein